MLINYYLTEIVCDYRNNSEFSFFLHSTGTGKLTYHGDGEIDTFLSLLMMLKPTAMRLDSCLIAAPFCKTEMRILSLSCLGRDEILSMGIPRINFPVIQVGGK